MISRLKLMNFKCFESINIEMSNLNVLAGINSMGKSTIVQALLLLRQSYELGAIDNGLHLNGLITNIGTGQDLMYRGSEIDEVGITIMNESQEFKLLYTYNKDSDFQALKKSDCDGKNISEINLFQKNFSYISAERIGPQRIYNKSYYQVVDKNQIGFKGELFADYLSEHGTKLKVENKAALHPMIESHLLVYQVEGWLSEITPGVTIDTRNYNDAGLVGLIYKIADSKTTNSFSPLNVGFGLSYIIPVIISLLKAKKGDLVIIENPEAHLHPRGQRKMGELISRVCAGGVQVILETHSDHILNGIRLCVMKKTINRNLVRLNYFYQMPTDNKIVHTKCSPAILDDGSLSDWPEGFFDEWEKAIDELF